MSGYVQTLNTGTLETIHVTIVSDTQFKCYISKKGDTVFHLEDQKMFGKENIIFRMGPKKWTEEGEVGGWQVVVQVGGTGLVVQGRVFRVSFCPVKG